VDKVNFARYMSGLSLREGSTTARRATRMGRPKQTRRMPSSQLCTLTSGQGCPEGRRRRSMETNGAERATELALAV
jgi:hypothetical protein